MAEGAQFTTRDIYRAFRADRNQSLHRVLRRLPYDFLVALIEGLEQADVIAPGRLFAGRRGGCAVGVTLRVLYPHYQGRRVIWGRRLRRSIARLRREHAQEISHLYALEQVFDRSIELLCEQFYWVPGGELAIATASWVADEARTELVLRELNSDWLDRIMAARQAPAPREPAAATAPALSMA